MTKHRSSVHTRVATLDEVGILLAWAAKEGWNPGIDDKALFHATDPSGFFITIIDEIPVAGVSVVKHTSKHAFLGLYLCLPEYRGSGVGLATWQAALATTEGHVIGLDGVVDQQSNYQKSGFDYCFGNKRFSGVLVLPEQSSGAASRDRQVHICRATAGDVGKIVQYDALIGGFERTTLFNSWLETHDSRYLFMAQVGDSLMGVVGLRKCGDGFKVGPWLADSEAAAMALLQPVVDICGSENVMIDVPSANNTSVAIMESLGLASVFDTARMYKGHVPAIDVARLFGVATLELG